MVDHMVGMVDAWLSSILGLYLGMGLIGLAIILARGLRR